MSNEKLEALLTESTLSDEFKASAKSIFDEAVEAKAAAIAEVKEAEIKAQYNTQLAEQAAALQEQVDSLVDAQLEEEYESISSHLNNYLQYVVEEFVAKHEDELVSAQKRFVSSQFMAKLAEAFEEFNIQEPEKANALEEAQAKYEAEINDNYETISRLVEEREDARRELDAAKRDMDLLNMVEEKGLSDLQVQKLYSLMESQADLPNGEFMNRAAFVADTMVREAAKPAAPAASAAVLPESAEGEQVIVEAAKPDAKEEVITEAKAPVAEDDVEAVLRALSRFHH